jgi:hypothetical protein
VLGGANRHAPKVVFCERSLSSSPKRLSHTRARHDILLADRMRAICFFQDEITYYAQA